MSESNIISPVVAHSNSQPRLSQVSAYDCFLRHFYNQVYKPGTEKTLVDVHRIAEERWKGMSTSERKPYKEMANQERERLGLGLEMPGDGVVIATEESGAGTRKHKRAAAKAARDPNAPKRATTAFFYYAQENRKKVKEENPEMKVTEISKKLGEMWRELSDEDKRKFLDLAEKDKARYQEQIKVYKGQASNSAEGEEQAEEQ